MVQLSLFYYRGQLGLKQDYAKAHTYFIHAIGPSPYRQNPGDFKPNGFALNNLGVLFRDGLGVPVNRQIAHALFTFEYAANGYSEESVGLASGNLNRDWRELDQGAQDAVLCMNMRSVWDHVKSKGTTPAIEASADNPRIRDWKDWRPGEISKSTC